VEEGLNAPQTSALLNIFDLLLKTYWIYYSKEEEKRNRKMEQRKDGKRKEGKKEKNRIPSRLRCMRLRLNHLTSYNDLILPTQPPSLPPLDLYLMQREKEGKKEGYCKYYHSLLLTWLSTSTSDSVP
jgi:hypothetical protein